LFGTGGAYTAPSSDPLVGLGEVKGQGRREGVKEWGRRKGREQRAG